MSIYSLSIVAERRGRLNNLEYTESISSTGIHYFFVDRGYYGEGIVTVPNNVIWSAWRFYDNIKEESNGNG